MDDDVIPAMLPLPWDASQNPLCITVSGTVVNFSVVRYKSLCITVRGAVVNLSVVRYKSPHCSGSHLYTGLW